jgi:alpha-glucuronidase
MKFLKPTITFLLLYLLVPLHADDGHKLWLNFKPLPKSAIKSYSQFQHLYTVTNNDEVANNAVSVFNKHWTTMMGKSLGKGNANSKKTIALIVDQSLDYHKEGFIITSSASGVNIAAKSGSGLLYGVYHLLLKIKRGESLQNINIKEAPKTNLRMLNHWDNLDRTIERGYAGFSIFNWHNLPDITDPIYEAYAEANASIGINGVVVTNVNANALILRDDYIEKVQKLADIFRKYGIKIYLTARFSAPIQLGGMKTADPLNEEVQAWWKKRIDHIYTKIPDFGGFVVKANSEGQPGPQDYKRDHADGANMLARPLRAYGGLVIWRAFVYSADVNVDRIKQAYNEFIPLDGKFESNVIVQVKNGPLDFQPREPVHALFGAMKKTPLMIEFQITKEYLGQANHLVGLAEMYEEILKTDTYTFGKGSTVDKVLDGSLTGHSMTGIAGVSNVGTDRNWTGHLFNQADWYAFGRLAWDPYINSTTIFDEWIKLTFGNEKQTVETIHSMLQGSHEMIVNYMTPLGLHHIMAEGHHYGPGPWVDSLHRADWTAVYYHKANKDSIGYDRGVNGSNALAQYSQDAAQMFIYADNCPPEYLLWFHRVPWSKKLSTGRNVWEEMVYRYDLGVQQVKKMQSKWKSLAGKIDQEQYEAVEQKLALQVKEAIWWRNACLSYFQSKNGLPYPQGTIESPLSVEYYKSLSYPFSPGIKPKW